MSWVALVPLKMDDSLFLFLFSLKSTLKAVSRQSVIFSLVFSLSRQGLHSVSRMFQLHHCWVATSLVLRWLFLYYRSMYVEYCLLLLLLLLLLLPLLLLLYHTWSPGEPVPLSHADAEPDSGALLRMDVYFEPTKYQCFLRLSFPLSLNNTFSTCKRYCTCNLLILPLLLWFFSRQALELLMSQQKEFPLYALSLKIKCRCQRMFLRQMFSPSCTACPLPAFRGPCFLFTAV